MSGKTGNLGPCLVWAVNFSATNPFPRKFIYTACSHVAENGFTCNKSLDFGTTCGHSSTGQTKFRFHVILIDAVHAGTPPGTPPCKAQIWDTTSALLKCPPQDFNELDSLSHFTLVQKVLQQTPRLAVWLWVKGLEITLQCFTFVGDAISIPSHRRLWPPRQLCPPPL